MRSHENRYREKIFLRNVLRRADFQNTASWQLGQEQLDFLLAAGLDKDWTMADIGCGPLRLGCRIIDYLERGHYYGMDINAEALDLGKSILARLNVTGDNYTLIATDSFDFGRLNRPLDVAFSNSLFSHLSEDRIRLCLGNLRDHLKPGASYYSTLFLLGDGAPLEARHHWTYRGKVITTKPDRNPFHYRPGDIRALATAAGYTMEIVPAYHPIQTMVKFTKQDPDASR